MTFDLAAVARPLLGAVVAVAVGCTLLVALVAGVAGWRGVRLARRMAAGRAAISRALVAEPTGADVALLQLLPGRTQVALVLEFGPSLAGREREGLTHLGLAMGVIALAERHCRSSFWWRRLRGARVLTALDYDSTAMRPLLRDASPGVRAQALVWAAGRVDEEVIEELVRHLVDPERLCRFTVQDSLLRLGRPAASALARFLSAGPSTGLAEGLAVARGLAQPELLAPALTLTAHRDEQVRARAVGVLAVLGGEEAVRTLTDRLADVSPVVRAAAARATGELGYWQAAPSIARLLRDSSWPVRREAALSLRRLGGAGILSLRRALTDENPFAADMARQVLDLPDQVYKRIAS